MLSRKRSRTAVEKRKKRINISIIIGIDIWRWIFTFLSADYKIWLSLCRIQKAWTLQKIVHPFIYVELQAAKSTYRTDHTFFWLNNLQAKNPILSCLHLKSIAIDGFLRLDLSSFMNCSHLKLNMCRYINLPPNIETLSLNSCADINFLACSLNHLTHFSIETHEEITNDDLLLFQFYPKLTELGFVNCAKITNISNLKYCLQLRYLEINDEIEGLQALTQLETLHPPRTVRDLSSIRCLIHLKTLIIANCSLDLDLSVLDGLKNLKLVFADPCENFKYVGSLDHEIIEEEYWCIKWFVAERIKQYMQR
jgi:hypothetical protein